MGYKHTNSRGVEYCLHGKEVTLRNGFVRSLHFFAKDEREGHCDIPEGYMVSETRNGLPVVKKDPDYVTPEAAAMAAEVPEETI